MSLQYNEVLSKDINFNYWVKMIPTKGKLAWEYNPFRNYRLLKDAIQYKGIFHILNEDKSFEFEGITYSYKVDEDMAVLSPGDITDFTYYKAGSLIDLDTTELNFDLEHPVDIIPQYSYDGSVNLILNDGNNYPKLINSRFSPIGRNEYLIVDRTGISDTNIYDLGNQFEIDTSLYKKTLSIPKVQFRGTIYGGTLPIGNYHFYFKLMDADGNTTDFIAESGLVSVFIGSTPSGIKSGFRNENSNKLVSFYLSNIDTAYPYIEVYYTRATSDIRLNYIKEAKRINKKFVVNGTNGCSIIINGAEDSEDISLLELNLQYNTVSNACTQAVCQNRLFLGNVHTQELDYVELLDLALRFTPNVYYSTYNPYSSGGVYANYGVNNESYYDPKFIYGKVGYWPEEYYRLGVVFILNNNTLSPVFNIRGSLDIDSEFKWIDYPLQKDGKRNYLQIDENTYDIVNDSNITRENAAGVIRFKESAANQIIGIEIKYTQGLMEALQKINILGFFFVRQTRIPTIICQALTIATDTESNTPLLKTVNGSLLRNESYKEGTKVYITERIADNDKFLNPLFEQRLYYTDTGIRTNAAICPEYVVNQAYLNSFFTGDELEIVESTTLPKKDTLEFQGRHLYNLEYVYNKNPKTVYSKVIGVPDSTSLTGIDEASLFSSKAGNGEEAKRFKFIGYENKISDANNILRGNFGAFIGFSKQIDDNRIVNIKTKSNADQKQIRILDNSAYFAISDRFSIGDSIPTIYRGDCYICLFTHRIIRNFNSTSAPYNDIIVDPDTLKDNFEYKDDVLNSEKLEKVNVGDLNSVKLGLWVTFTFRSSINLNIRGIDESFIEEASESGHARSFYPLQPMSADGVYKLPDAECYNSGLNISVSDKWNLKLDNTVPYRKNEFSNRILYSDISVTDAFENGFRVFRSTNYRDYPKTYGSITKLIEYSGNLVCVFEHGVCLIPVNERAVAAQGDGGYAFINTSNVLPENPKVLSDSFGSLWRDSIIKTQNYIYGIDTVARKIWRTNGSYFECISDFKILKFLNDNISLGERELTPLIGIRNVKSFYNSYKHDVLFTFYDNLNGFEEKVWNICYNEIQELFTTFYSWVPSLMECIDNIPFSFDRNTAKWISRMTHSNILSNNIISKGGLVGTIELDNIESVKLCKDIWGNYKDFYIDYNSNMSSVDGNKWELYFVGENGIEGITSELYERNEDGSIKKDSSGKRIYLPEDKLKNSDKIARLLNIRVIFKNGQYKDYTVAVMPEYNKQFLTTDFWKHGQAGIIDIAEDIYPTYWYGKQHPFEFEFVVVDNPAIHKIFTNIELIANKAKPESFHYEIVGECYDFVKDKPNMYYRQEAMKALCQYKGLDISYDRNFVKAPLAYNNKSADFPHTYYARKDSINDVEDSYVKATSPEGKDYRNITGAELIYYPDRQEYRIWQHQNAHCLDDLNQELSSSILKANCKYLEDRWKIHINPIRIAYKNEVKWDDKPPFAIKNVSVPGFALALVDKEEINDHNNVLNGTNIIVDNDEWKYRKELDLKDKFIKVRIRYSGKELAVIDFINTIYNISYS